MRLSLRARLLLLIAAFALPIAAALWLILIEYRDSLIADARTQLRGTARFIALDIDDGVRGAMQLLTGLAHAPELGAGEREACSRFLAPLVKRFTQYSGIATFMPDGIVRCDGALSGRVFSVKDRPYFERALYAKEPFAAEVQIGRGTGLAVVPVLHAARDAAGNFSFLLLAALNLEAISRRYSRGQLPPEAVVEIWDSAGTLLARTESGKDLVGKKYPEAGISKLVQRTEGDIESETTGITGVNRVWAVAVPLDTSEAGLRVAVGIPRAVLVAPAERAIREIAAAFSLMLFAALAFAWWLAERWIGKPIARLAAVAGKLQAGDLTARAGAPYAHDEIGAVASEFDLALAAIEELKTNLEIRVAQRAAQLALGKARAESADRLKSTFLATLSHELRTPLSSIIGFTGILIQELAGPLNPEQAKQLGMVQASARHLLALINDVLDISKIEAGQLDVARQPFDLRASIAKVLGIVAPLAEKKGLALRTGIAPGLGEVIGDARRFEQVLLNLFSNAIKFTERGEIAFTAALDGASAILRVTDSGIGIKPQDMQALFQPFRQIDDGLARNATTKARVSASPSAGAWRS